MAKIEKKFIGVTSMDKIKELIKKILTKEVILYIVFGVFTTVVNLASFYVMNSILNWN